MKSSSSTGPRVPDFNEFWLSAIRTPWFVVSGWPPPSTRTRSSGPVVGLLPSGALPPVLADVLASDSVLAVGRRDGVHRYGGGTYERHDLLGARPRHRSRNEYRYLGTFDDEWADHG